MTVKMTAGFFYLTPSALRCEREGEEQEGRESGRERKREREREKGRKIKREREKKRVRKSAQYKYK